MLISETILYMYPGAEPLEDWEVRDDGNGQYISQWNETKLGSRPTDADLQAAALPALKAQKRDKLILAADADYRAVFTRDGTYVELEKDYLLLRRSFGLVLTPLQQDQAQRARAVVEKLQSRLQAVNAAVTEAEVEAVAW